MYLKKRYKESKTKHVSAPKNIVSDGSPQIAEVNNLQLICDKDAGLGKKVRL